MYTNNDSQSIWVLVADNNLKPFPIQILKLGTQNERTVFVISISMLNLYTQQQM